MPFTAFLARIKKIFAIDDSDRYTAIERGFRDGSLRQPASPMSDAELSQAIAEFTKGRPTAGSMNILGGRFKPKA
jgi:hypothetical protein